MSWQVIKELEESAQSHSLMLALTMKRTGILNTTSGVGSVMTTTEDTLIDILRPMMISGKCGVKYLTGLQGKIALPRKSAASTAYWVGEGTAPTTSNATLDQIVFQPKTVGAYTDITRQFAELTSLDAEELVRDDLLKTIGVEVDTRLFQGDGSNSTPTGILKTSGIGFQETNGGQPRFSDLVALETTVSNANALVDGCVYATTPNMRGFLKARPRSSTAVGAGFVWQDDNTINGYPAFSSNVLPNDCNHSGTIGSGTDSAVLFGNFADCIVGFWGALDILVDPYTLSSSGGIRIVALQDLDVEIRHAASFAALYGDTNPADDEAFGT